MSNESYQPWNHRLAVLTACLALLPIGMGALVTTKDAGMAFPDWPTSDGHGMFAYPWLRSAGEKFLEHGHRLAGTLIGLASIALALAFTVSERRAWVKSLAWLALAAVIVQGVLGGVRVLRDARELALVHGSFAALVFALFCSLAVITSRGWRALQASAPSNVSWLRGLAGVTVACVMVQYALGGLLRHQGLALYEHLGFAAIVAIFAIWLAMAAMASGGAWLRGPAVALAFLVVAQLALGAGAWVTKFGFGDQVAVYGSPMQIVMRTGHVLGGMLLYATTVVLALRIFRLHHAGRASAGSAAEHEKMSGRVALPGGVA